MLYLISKQAIVAMPPYFAHVQIHISALTDHSHFEGEHGIATRATGGALVQTTVFGKAGIRQSNGCGVR